MTNYILISGSAGFFSYFLCKLIFETTNWHIIGIDKLSPVSSLMRLGELFKEHPEYEKRFTFYWHDLRSPIPESIANEIRDIKWLVHTCSQSHVEDAFRDVLGCLADNTGSTINLFEFAKTCPNLKMGISYQSDECFGPAPDGVAFKETDGYNSGNFYSAAKCGAAQFTIAYANCGTNLIVTYCTNLIGPKQNIQKFLPLLVKNILEDKKTILHCDEQGNASRRVYVHCTNAAHAVLFLLKNGKRKESYNIQGQQELTCLELGERVAQIIGKPFLYEKINWFASRPFHEKRYYLDSSKLDNMGFKFPLDFNQSLEETIKFMIDPQNRHWLY